MLVAHLGVKSGEGKSEDHSKGVGDGSQEITVTISTMPEAG